MNILNLNLVDNGIDQKVIELLSKSMPQEDLEKALNRSGLVQRIIQVKTKHGIVNRKQWVRASELKQPEKPRKKTAVEIEELAIEGAKLPKIYGKTIRDLTPQQIEDLNNIAVPRARMTALKNLIGEEGSIKWALELGLKWKRYPDDLEKDWANAHRAIKRYFIAGNKIHVPDGNAKVEPKKATDTKSYEDLKTLLNDLENKYNNSMIDVTINDNLPNHTVKATKITHETEKAVAIDISIADHGGYKERVFLPKSQVKIVGDQVVGVKGWVIAKKNLQSLLISGNGKHNLFKYDVKVLDDVNDTKRVEPKAEPKVADTKKEEPKKDPNVKPQPYGKIYKSVADFPKDTIIIRDRKSFIEKFRGKTLTLVGECKDLFHVRLFQDEQGNNYRVDNLEYMIKFFKFTSPKVLTHTEDRDGKLYDVTTYTFDDGVKLKNPTDDLRDFEKVDSSVLEPNRSMAGVKADKPMRFERANSRSVNPHRYDSTSDKEKKGYMNNCQTCVVAFEARLRGYNVEAKPKSKPTNKTDASMYAYNTMVDLSYDTTLAWDKEQRLDIVKYEKGRTNAYNWMNKTIKKGERYHLYYYHKGLRGGHIVTAFKDDDGEPVIYDPQSGESTKGKADIIDYFAYKTTHATMYRVDNLKFNFDVMNKIVKESK